MQRQRRKLTVEDQVAIELRRKDGWGVRAIARELGRSPSVISAELGREPHGFYAAGPAQAAAAAQWDRSRRRAGQQPASLVKLLIGVRHARLIGNGITMRIQRPS